MRYQEGGEKKRSAKKIESAFISSCLIRVSGIDAYHANNKPVKIYAP